MVFRNKFRVDQFLSYKSYAISRIKKVSKKHLKMEFFISDGTITQRSANCSRWSRFLKIRSSPPKKNCSLFVTYIKVHIILSIKFRLILVSGKQNY